MVSPDGAQAPRPAKPGVALLRDDETTAFLRARIERPSHVGLWGLLVLGALTAGIGAALWVLSRTSLAIGLVILGAILMALGYAQYRLYRRDLAHWPDEAILWDEGIELVLHNGDVRGVSWTDPDLALNLVARRAPPPAGREFLLVWMSEGKIPSAELSEAGFDRVQRAAVAQGLTVVHHRRGRRADATQTVEIRQSPARQLASRTPRPEGEPASAPSTNS